MITYGMIRQIHGPGTKDDSLVIGEYTCYCRT